MIKPFSKLDFQSTKKGFNELKQRFIFLIIALIIFRIGSFIPIPGINLNILNKLIRNQNGTIIDMFNIFSGGALSRASILALGIMPYISASIILQLLSVLHPKLIALKKEGEVGRRKINTYTKYTTLILSIIQSIGIVTGLPKISGMQNLILNPGICFFCISVLSLVTGTIFLMWLGEQITNKGIGNGISMIIVIGIISNLPSAIGHTIEQIKEGDLNFFIVLIILLIIFTITFFVVFMERGQRKITVNYAKRYNIRNIYKEQNTHLPLKINMSGVIPAIFSSSIILFFVTIISWFGNSTGWEWLKNIAIILQPKQMFYMILYVSLIIFFCFFYTILVFSPKETADNLKKSGAYIPGIRPGEQTAKYIKKIILRLTLTGGIYMSFICLIPEFLRNIINVPFYFGGTSLLIVVVVIMDFITQIQTLIMSTQYESMLKKINLKS
ncbi:preprotein translocase subunit SecY [Enterobacteriaceae endosymbiont of Plateumaris pusilla]|uniref:preprotein translocase subunit SecY n=1 Tax=Enterobacteriaceae endosymbiont of Plateumaris pusilla TaxID=2675795 RepID=UPI001449BAE8|nr:preprotein translocase subunit SecY [Enterobacteriaceae endosymbiont of Plateumaris pusilla]QJC29559.1 preprotein translocase subunit SecY [Enterobacteriaceae endosymbiont of Plateumaris pusilla]